MIAAPVAINTQPNVCAIIKVSLDLSQGPLNAVIDPHHQHASDQKAQPNDRKVHSANFTPFIEVFCGTIIVCKAG